MLPRSPKKAGAPARLATAEQQPRRSPQAPGWQPASTAEWQPLARLQVVQGAPLGPLAHAHAGRPGLDCAAVDGFSALAAVRCESDKRKRLAPLCGCITVRLDGATSLVMPRGSSCDWPAESTNAVILRRVPSTHPPWWHSGAMTACQHTIWRLSLSDNRGYVPPAYLEATARLVAPIKRRSYELMEIGPAARVADIGCGIGIDVLQLTRLVGEGGQVFGLDADPAMTAEARRRLAAASPAASFRLDCAQSDALPYQAGALDACRSERLFQHLEEPQRTLAEMCRVTRPGGRVVVLDTDWGGMSVDAADPDIERRLACFKAAASLRNGFAARRLPALFRGQGLKQLTIEVLPLYSTSYEVVRFACNFDDMEQRALAAGVLTQAELTLHDASLRAADSAGDFFGVVCMILVAGTMG